MPSSLPGGNHQATLLVADRANHLKNGSTPEAHPSTPAASEDMVDTDTDVDMVDTADVDIEADMVDTAGIVADTADTVASDMVQV